MEDYGLVSIIMPSYNSSRFIDESIDSVLSQTYQNWELLITDDCSTDNTIEIINEYIQKDNRIKIFKHNINSGAAIARNNSIEKANGKFLAFLDSDDLWYPNKLELQLEFMNKNKIAFSCSNYDQIYENGEFNNIIIKVPNIISYYEYLKNTIIGCLTVIIDKSIVGDFRMPNIKSSHDMALWLLILKKGYNCFGLNKTLGTYRLVSNSNTAKKGKAAKDVWKVYREIENLNIIFSSYCFMFYVINAIKKRI
ncbi:MAG: glycosyl transferase [Bacteroidetes bacterium]|nr:glycosyl transferase [Bacteroidota bacterium]